MNKMIERVARAICATMSGTGDDHQWEMFVDEARAAIEAMREPTQAMRDAMNDDIDWDGDAVRAYVAGIDAALTEEK